MACIHCGSNPPTEVFALRFLRETDEQLDLELPLCPGCLDELLLDPEIELLEPALVSTDDPAPEADR